MQLTKEQIQEIDQYLKKDVTHWDIRIEILDHLVSKIEDSNSEFSMDNIKKELPYYKIKRIANQRRRSINIKYNKIYRNEMKRFFTRPINLIGLVLFALLEIYINARFGFKKLVLFSMITLFIPLLVPLFYSIKNWIKGNRSYNLEVIFTKWIGITTTLFYLIIMLSKTNISKTLILVLFVLNSVLHISNYFIGYKIYTKILANYTAIFNNYKTLKN